MAVLSISWQLRSLQFSFAPNLATVAVTAVAADCAAAAAAPVDAFADVRAATATAAVAAAAAGVIFLKPVFVRFGCAALGCSNKNLTYAHTVSLDCCALSATT